MPTASRVLSVVSLVVATALTLAGRPATAAGFDGLLPPPPAAVRRGAPEQPVQAARLVSTPAPRVAASIPDRPAPSTNPFAGADLVAMLRRCRDLRIDGGRNPAAVLTRTGDRLALADVDERALTGRLEDGTWVVALPFLDRANAQHAVVVLAWLENGPRYAGGFSAAGDHLSLTVARTIDVDFFRTASRGKTLAAGGTAPSSSLHLAIVDGRLAAAAAPVVASTRAVASVVTSK